jgi:hypothetical protein
LKSAEDEERTGLGKNGSDKECVRDGKERYRRTKGGKSWSGELECMGDCSRRYVSMQYN